jgi:SAM-dependent methyltransferase
MKKKVGILYDNISGNMGDLAIGLSVKKILRELRLEFDELVPGRFDPQDYATIIVGGGHLLRPHPDFFYDKFRVSGTHVLNCCGIVGAPPDLEYLNDYTYVSVRSGGDKGKISYLTKEVKVIPCTSMLLSDVPHCDLNIQRPSIGIQLWEGAVDEDALVEYLSRAPFHIYFLPITHYNYDFKYLVKLTQRLKNSSLLPILETEEVFTLMGNFDYFISASLHGAIFAYVHRVPFILFDYQDKMKFFMQDRNLDKYLFKNFDELRLVFEKLLHDNPDYSTLLDQDFATLKEHKRNLKEVLPSQQSVVLFNKLVKTRSEVELLREKLESKNVQVGYLQKQVAAMNDDVKRQNPYIKELERDLNEKRTHVGNLESTLNQIYDSHGWKALLTYYRMRDKILPIDTKRELLAKLFFKAVTDPKGILSNFKKIDVKKLGCYFRKSKPAISQKETGEKTLEVSGQSAVNPIEGPEGRDDLTPPSSMIFVGDGDFKAVGEEFKRYFLELGQLRPEDRVLDVGCGIGRMAVPLIGFLSPGGEYWGFDIVEKGIEWCQSHIAERYGNFHFLHCDVYNKVYNPSGKMRAKDYTFPFENDSFDFVFLTSVFTHMLPQDMKNYLSEVSRVMKPGGTCLITFFLITQEVRNLIDMGLSTQNFKYEVDGCLTTCKEAPEGAIGYDQEFILQLFQKYDLKINEQIHYGSWCGRTSFLSYQDIVMATRD